MNAPPGKEWGLAGYEPPKKQHGVREVGDQGMVAEPSDVFNARANTEVAREIRPPF
jgi:hypothetical protein